MSNNLILKTRRIFTERYVFTIYTNMDNIKQVGDRSYYFISESYIIYKQKNFWYIHDKNNFIIYADNIVYLSEDIATIQAIIDKANEEMCLKRNRGDIYYAISECNLHIDKYTDNFNRVANERFAIGNYFKTEKEAKEVQAKLVNFWKEIRSNKNKQDEGDEE